MADLSTSNRSADRSLALRKWSSLSILILFTTATSIVSQRSRSGDRSKSYSVAASVFMSELFKLLLGFGWAVASRAGAGASKRDGSSLPFLPDKSQEPDQTSSNDRPPSPGSPALPHGESPSWIDCARQAWNDIFCPSAWMMGVPALVYVCQNMLQIASNSYISSVAYQGLSQLKLVTAAAISSYMFGNTLLLRQWMCLPVLLIGVLFLIQQPVLEKEIRAAATLLGNIELDPDSPFAQRHGGASAFVAEAAVLAGEYANARLAVGALYVLLASCCGSFASVYIEVKLKTSMSVPLSVRNAQLASFAMVTAGFAVIIESLSSHEFAPLRNFTTLAWLTVILRGLAGYVVSATLRYADTIMKGFATSLAIIVTIAAESLLSSHLPRFVQLLGSSIIMLATYRYIVSGAARKA